MDAAIPADPLKDHSLRNQFCERLLDFRNHVTNALFHHPPLYNALERVLSIAVPSKIS